MGAVEYRENAEEMMRCARATRDDFEREDYVRLAKAWTILAAGAERGLKTHRGPGEPTDPAEGS